MVYIYTSSAETVGTSVEEFKRPEIRREYEKLHISLPIRTSAMHVCLEEPEDNSMVAKHPALFNTMRALVILLLRHTTRVRTRVHQGKEVDDGMRMWMISNTRRTIGVVWNGSV